MKIAIVKLSALGDIVHAMVVLQYIKKSNKNIEVDWIVEENYKELLEFHPEINNVHVINIKKAKMKKSFSLLFNNLKKVRKLGPYDLVIDMQGLIKSAIVSRLIRSKVTLGFDKTSSRESIASLFYNKTFNYGYSENIIHRNFALMDFGIGLKDRKQAIDNKLPFLYAGQKYSNINLSNSKKNILLIPGASHISKCYSGRYLAELTTLIDANYLVIWGDLKEKKMAEEIKIISPAVNICEKLSINSLISLISQVDLVVGPDTGPTHIAWALNIASITIFGPTPGYRNSYATKINRIIESDSTVNPLKINKSDNSINAININKIAKISIELLKK